MTDHRHIIPFIMLWEEGVKTSLYNQMPWQDYYAKCKEKGLHIIPDDAGGPTVCGVTLGTYKDYKKRKGLPVPTSEDLVQIGAEEWMDLFKTMFWDKCNAGKMLSQAVADFIVDWFWTSGVYALKRVQRVVGVTQDGIIGNISLGAINAFCSDNWRAFLDRLKDERIDYYKAIVRRKSSQRKFLNGWINRTNACVKWR